MKSENEKFCKDCPCCDGGYCKLNPPQVTTWQHREEGWQWDSSYPGVQDKDWCYRGRQIMFENMVYQKAPF